MCVLFCLPTEAFRNTLKLHAPPNENQYLSHKSVPIWNHPFIFCMFIAKVKVMKSSAAKGRKNYKCKKADTIVSHIYTVPITFVVCHWL